MQSASPGTVGERDVATYDLLDEASDRNDVETEPSSAEADRALDRLTRGRRPKKEATP